MAAVAGSGRDDHLFDLDEIACLFQVGNPCLTAFVTVHTFVLAGQLIHGGIFVDAAWAVQSVSLSDHEVVFIVGRSDLNSTGSFFRIRIRVSDDRDLASYQRQDHGLADHVGISFVFRVNGNGHITEHGFRSGCSNNDAVSFVVKFSVRSGYAIRCRITEIPVGSLFVFVFNFRIAEGCTALRAPVDQTVSSVNQAFIVQLNKEVVNGFVATFVHGEAFSLPVTGVAKLAALVFNPAAVFSLPVPGTL